MIAGLKPYPVMKDSGVEWLGEVPEHWETPRLGNLLRERGETNADGQVADILSVVRERGVIPYAEKGNIGNKHSEDITRYKIVRPNDIVVNCMNVIIGSVGLSRYTGCLSPVYYVLKRRFDTDNPRYLNAYFQTKPFQQSLIRIGNGILAHRMRIPMELLKCEAFPRPPDSEQAAIVRYLDHVDRRVRRLVRAKRKLIALLTEQKQVIIHRAVTRGLDPDVPLKDSGVEWLGEVPAHWEVMLLGRALTGIGQGWSPVAAEGDISPDQWAVLTLSSVKKGKFDPKAIKPISIGAQIPDGIEICDGDLLLTRSNTRELVGDACIVTGVRPRTVMCDLIYRLVPDSKSLDPSFLMYQLLSRVGRRQIEQDARGSSGTMPKISQRHIRGWRVIRPPLDEQERICSYIVDATERIDSAIGRAGEEIELINEYRTRLTADVVTGKLDVREVAAALPEVDPLATDDKPDTVDAEPDTDFDEAAGVEVEAP
jgi:type I restriction enzyme S subunit